MYGMNATVQKRGRMNGNKRVFLCVVAENGRRKYASKRVKANLARSSADFNQYLCKVRILAHTSVSDGKGRHTANWGIVST